MKSIEKLHESGILFLKIFDCSILSSVGRRQLEEGIDHAIEFIHDALQYLGAAACRKGELDRVGLALMWFSVMLETSPCIGVSAWSTDDGFILRAAILKDAQIERDGKTVTANQDYSIRQLFFYNDTRSLEWARKLCRNRAAELVDAVFEADNDTN